MRTEYMLQMGSGELDAYARSIGLDTTGIAETEAKVDAIQRRREREAEVSVLGITLRVPMKRLHDLHLTERFVNGGLRVSGDRELMALMRGVLGDDQADALVDRATDEDGTVDTDALALAFTTVMGSDDVKNS